MAPAYRSLQQRPTQSGNTLTIPQPFNEHEPRKSAAFRRDEQACCADGDRRNELNGDWDEALGAVVVGSRML